MWHKMSKKELIAAIEQLERIARDNKDLAERSVAQAREWMRLYEEASSTENDMSHVSSQTH